MAVHRVITLAFGDPQRCRSAYGEAVDLPGLHQAAVLERAEDGTLDLPLSHSADGGETTVGAGAAGGLVGLLGGPVGALLGATSGVLLGSAVEGRREAEGIAAMIVLSADVDDSTSLLVLDISEKSGEPVNDLAARHGTVCRRQDAREFAARVRKAWKNAGS